MKSSQSEEMEELRVLVGLLLDLSSLLHSVQANMYLMFLWSIIFKENLWEIISFSVDNSLLMAILTQ